MREFEPSAPLGAVQSGKYKVGVLYEDNHLLVVVKPPNLPVQADASGDIDLLTLMKGYIGEKYHKPGAVYLGLCHRLDRPVGGMMVLARTSKAAARLSAAFAGHGVQKTYLAVVRGAAPDQMELCDYLLKDGRSGMVKVVEASAPGAKQARLVSENLARREGLSLQKVRLMTGRSHQIRVQHANAGFPLWGDARYGQGRPGEQIALWAARLEFEHPTRKTPMRFVSLPPESGAWAVFRDEIKGDEC